MSSLKQIRAIPIPGLRAVMFVCLLIGVSAVSAVGQVQLTVQETRRRAVDFNRTYLQARQDVKIANTNVTRAWADALPNLSFNGRYGRNFIVPSIFFEVDGQTVQFKTGFKNNFNATVALEQPIWQGGKVFKGLQVAKLYKGYSEAIAQQVRSEIVYNAEQLFYDAIRTHSDLEVWQQAYESNSANYRVVKQKYDQGMVSEYELLRAKVEMQNALPEILAAESEVTLAEKRLKSFIGLPLSDSMTVIEPDTDTSLTTLPDLPTLKDTALALRPEMVQARRLVEISGKAVSIARAAYWPDLNAFAQYDWSAVSDDFTLTNNNSRSWTAGLTVSFTIFDGFRRKGDVDQRQAEFRQAQLGRQQAEDDITLEVEQAYDRLIQAKKALDIQGATIAAAEEGLKIATVRYESGVGTQLEVLSAQSALTQARSVQAQALFSFRVARAGLKRATTIEL